MIAQLDTLSNLSEFGFVGALLAVVFGLVFLLLRDLLKQRDRFINIVDKDHEQVAKLAASLEKLADERRAMHEMLVTMLEILRNIQSAGGQR